MQKTTAKHLLFLCMICLSLVASTATGTLRGISGSTSHIQHQLKEDENVLLGDDLFFDGTGETKDENDAEEEEKQKVDKDASPSPTIQPSMIQTREPVTRPTSRRPTVAPTVDVTSSPSDFPTERPTNLPTSSEPSSAPTNVESASPTLSPTIRTPTQEAILVVTESPTTFSWAEKIGGNVEGDADGDTDENTDTRGDGWSDSSENASTLDSSLSNSTGTSSSSTTQNGGIALIGFIIILVFALVAAACCWGACLIFVRTRKAGSHELEETASSAGDDSSNASPRPSEERGDEETAGMRLKNTKRIDSWNSIMKLSLTNIEEEQTKQVRPNSDTPKTVPEANSYEVTDMNENNSEKDVLTVGVLPVLLAEVKCNILTEDSTQEDRSEAHVRHVEMGDNSGDNTISLLGSLPVPTAQHESELDKDKLEREVGKPSKGVESDGYETESVSSEDLEYMYGTLPMDKLPSTPKTRNTNPIKRSPDSVILDASSSRSLQFLSMTPHDRGSQYDNDWRVGYSNSCIRLESESEQDDDDDLEMDASGLPWV